MLYLAIDHPAISALDVRKLAGWYCQHMGMRILRDNGQEPASLLLGWDDDLRVGSTLEIMPVKDPGGPAPASMPRLCQGIRHFAVRVSDFDTAYAQLQAIGVPFLFEPTTAIGGGNVVSFRDPEGNEVQIVQR